MGCGNSTTRVKIESEEKHDRLNLSTKNSSVHYLPSIDLDQRSTKSNSVSTRSPDQKSKKKPTAPVKAIEVSEDIFEDPLKYKKKAISHQANYLKEILPNHIIDMYKKHKNISDNSNVKRVQSGVEYNQMVTKLTSYFTKKRSSGIMNSLDLFNFSLETNVVHDPVFYKTLDNKKMEHINYSFKFIKKYYKKQAPPSPSEGMYTDPLFPPNYDSIIGIRNGDWFDPDERRREKVKSGFALKKEDIVWLRPKDIFTGGMYCLFANDISIDDVLQGSIGNCYFLSSLAALTEIPQLIYQLFKSYKVSKQGYYEVAVRIQGKWKIVIVDDYFPCNAKTKKPIFAKARDAEIWVMLLEKVWAKINGGYLNTIAGSSTHIMSSFTSFSLSTLHHRKFFQGHKIEEDKMLELWDKIKSADEVGYIMTCNSYDSKEIEKWGIIAGHSFTMTQAKEAVVGGKKVRLLNLRNPWGYKEWNGAWSDNSPEWTFEAKIAFDIQVEASDDGKFWISFEDFLKFFALTNICRVYSPQCCVHFSIRKEVADKPHIFEVHLKSRSLFTVSAFKKLWRFHRKLSSDTELQINIIIVKKSKNKIEYVASTHEDEHDPGLEMTLEAGVYYVYVHANYKYSSFDTKRKYVVLFTSNNFFNAKFKEIDSENFDFLRGIVISRVENSYLKDSEDFTYFSNKFETTTYGIIYIVNKTEDTYNIVGQNESENFELISPSTIKDKFCICLEPGEKLIIIGIRKVYYDMFFFKFDIEPVLVDNQTVFQGEILQTRDMQHYLVHTEVINSINEDGYDFVFKKVDMDLDEIVTKIDFIEYSLNYFISKYPEVSFIIQNVPQLNDGEEVIFQDLYTINDHACYLGEWKVKQDFVKHGRGLCFFSDGTYYMGQFVNDQNNGYGILQFPTQEKIEISWVNGKMHGIGKHYKEDGSINEVEYADGILVSCKQGVFN